MIIAFLWLTVALCKRPVGGVLPPTGRFLFASCARAIPLVAGRCDARLSRFAVWRFEAL